jgi:hypothetical protein
MDDVPSTIIAGGGVVNGNNFKAITPAANGLRREADHKVVAYAGVRFSPLNCVYLTLACIGSRKRFEVGGYSLWRDGWMSMVCELPSGGGRMEEEVIDLEAVEVVEVEESLGVLKLLGQEVIEEVRRGVIGSDLVGEKIPKNMADLRPLLNLIYLYRHVNLCGKFTVPVGINRSLLGELVKLASFLTKPIA